MKNWKGMQNDVAILKGVTLEEFQAKYKELAYGENTEVVASQLFPLMDQGSTILAPGKEGEVITGRYDATIIYVTKSTLDEQSPDTKAALKLKI